MQSAILEDSVRSELSGLRLGELVDIQLSDSAACVLDEFGHLGRRTYDDRSGGGVACGIDDAAKVHCASHWPGVAEVQARMLQIPEAEVEHMKWVEIPDVRATAVAVGDGHVCAIDLDSFVVCWGDERRLDVPVELARPEPHVNSPSDRRGAAGPAARARP